MQNFKNRVALFILKDEQGRLLLQHRTDDAKVLPGYWAFFGGHIGKDETPKAAVKREAKEELNIDLNGLKFFKRYVAQVEGVGKYEKFVFTAELKHSAEQLRKQQKEGQDLGFFSAAEIKKLKISSGDIAILQDLFGEFGLCK
jgi:8-oxo-dGTP pyrophosphatase MutT (NUDIX family)